MSAGRVLDKIDDEYFAKIKFITDHEAIAKILTPNEFIKEVENQESDIHYLCENPANVDLEKIEKNFIK